MTRWPVLLATLALLATSAARAQSVDAEEASRVRQAHVLSDQGLQHFERGDYDEALASFKASYALAPLPELQFNIGQAYRRKGDCVRAVLAYRAYLRLVPDAFNRPKIEARIAELGCDPPDETPPVVTPPPATPVTPAAVAAPPRPSPWPQRLQLIGGTVLAVGLAAVLVGAVFSLDAVRTGGEVSQRFAGGGTWDPHAADLEAHGRAATVGAGAFYGVGAALGVGGALLAFLGTRQERARPLKLR